MSDRTPVPSTSLEDADINLNFDQPLLGGDGRYVDLGPARGEQTRQLLAKRFRRKQGGTFHHVVFASHRGAGKSTELHQLTYELTDRYRSLYLESNVEMDPNRIEMEDLLLVLAQQLEERMRSWGYPLDDALLGEVFGWFAEIIKSTEVGITYTAELSGEAGGGIEVPGLVTLTSRLKALLRVDSKHKTEVKEKLRQYPGTLTERVNQLMDAARRILKEKEGRELLVIIDNLDRYAPDVIDDLLLQQGDRFRNLRCDVIVTPPISLLYLPEHGQLEDYFHVEVMCSVKLREREEPYTVATGCGADLLLKALSRRLDVDLLIPDKAVQSRLLVACGGSIRELIELVSGASLYAEGPTITAGDLEKVIRKKRSRMRDKINASGWAEALAVLARDKQISKDPACLLVLYHRLAFKYNSEYWYDIHPLVAELPEVIAARASLS